jgi:L-asparaginase
MKYVLLIQTGGTIAMDITEGSNPRLDAAKGNDIIYQKIPELSEIAQIETVCPFFADSSDVSHNEWALLIECIAEHYNAYDGFVILHGTDTMAYTSSALSFGLQNLGKPVIMTGSQVPMANLRSDARRNLINAIEMATLPLSEVGICFNDFIYRGNRSTKMSIGDFDAFASPNYPPLAEIGLDIKINNTQPRGAGQASPAAQSEDLRFSTAFSTAVFLLKIYPGMQAEVLHALNLGSIRALIIESFGSGNFPLSGETELLSFFEKCIDAGILLIFTSQAAYDAVDLSKYESGRAAAERGAISAGDMTTEATLTKIMYLLEHCASTEELKNNIQTNIAGELTE